MTGHVLIPPTTMELRGAMIFLAGPIQGTADWQTDAIRIIHAIDSLVHIANPRREARSYSGGNFSPELYAQQVDWETKHLRRASYEGCVLFWLAREREHRCDRAYAQTTRAELFEWKVRHELRGAPLVLGIEEGYTGAKYIRRRFSQDCPDIAVRSTLEETCRDAVRLVTGVRR